MRTTIMGVALLAVVLTVLGGCIDESARLVSGKDFPYERLVGIQRGLSSDKDVRDLLGEPLRKETLVDGRELWTYYMKKAQRSAALGIIPTGTHVTETSLKITLGKGLVDTIEKSSEGYRE